jgi:uncharacterized membrane protein
MARGDAQVNWLIGLCLAGLIAGVAYRLRLLTVGGAWAAVGVGASVFGAGGVWASAPMVGFFFSSSLLPRLLGRSHKTERRTAAQVLANGLAPALCGWGAALTPAHAEAFWLGYITALATATADTWATRVRRAVRSPRCGCSRRGGVSLRANRAGVSWQGTLGGIAGACAIACLGAPLMGRGAVARARGRGWASRAWRWIACSAQRCRRATSAPSATRSRSRRAAATRLRSTSAACAGWTTTRSTASAPCLPPQRASPQGCCDNKFTILPSVGSPRFARGTPQGRARATASRAPCTRMRPHPEGSARNCEKLVFLQACL